MTARLDERDEDAALANVSLDAVGQRFHNAVFAAEQVTVFEADKSVSRLMTRADFKNRSAFGKAFDAVVGLLRQQL